MKTLTIDVVLDRWGAARGIDDVAKGVSDNDIWSMARMAAIIAGKRAQEIGNEPYEAACIEFVLALGGFIPTGTVQ